MRELSLNILDITENSVSAGASLIEIDVLEDTSLKTLSVCIRDNGRGMSEEMLEMSVTGSVQPEPRGKWVWEFPCSEWQLK